MRDWIKALADLTPLSRTVANEQIKEGKVLVNGAVKSQVHGQRRDIIQYEVPEVEEVSYEAEDLPLDIVYEGPKMLWWSIYLKAWLFTQVQVIPVGPWSMRCYTMSRDLSGINGELRPGIVHRIDKDTSGLLMFEK